MSNLYPGVSCKQGHLKEFGKRCHVCKLAAQRRYNKSLQGKATQKRYRHKEFCANGHKRTPDNLYARGKCRVCQLERLERYRRAKGIPKKRETDTVDLIVRAINKKLHNARRGAKDRGLDFSINFFDFPELPTHCPVLGIKLDYFGGDGRNNASIDRIDSGKGYVPGNVRIVSWRANSLKSNATAEELRLILTDIEQHDLL